MASSVVVKVKYGDTLRRFNAVLNQNKEMEFDIEGLRTKIRSLFNFHPEADLNLTYVDEDLDMVALVDQEDLRDVVRQGLNPVRITVQINTKKAGSARSSGSSTPVQPRINLSNQNLNATGFGDFLKSVPEPFREPLSKLSAEVTSKAETTSPILAELIKSFLNAHPPPQSGQPDVASASKETGEKDSPFLGDKKKKKNKNINDCKRKKDGSVFFPPVGRHEEASSSAKGKDNNDSISSKSKTVFSFPPPFPNPTEVRNTTSFNECPFSSLNMPMMPMPTPVLFPPPPPLNAEIVSPTNGDGTEGAIFHRGIRCDGCGVIPITGARFKSKVKYDYDLCPICFEQMGKDADYIRIDFPTPYPHPCSFKGNQLKNVPWNTPLQPPCYTLGGKPMKHFRPKLDSRFISDVNIMDGTVMAPKTPFTKIWRMRNNGNLPWARGTQLVWIGGDKFSPTDAVEIEVPLTAFSPETEVDVAVDFVAPELPGRYISYWKMASPSGQKFGQRIWVLVQVDVSLTDLEPTFPTTLNLNLPPEDTAENLPPTLDIDMEPLVDVEYEPSPVPPTTMIQTPLLDEQQNTPSFPDDLLYDNFPFASASSSSAPPLPVIPATPVISSPITYPTVEADLINPAPASSATPTQPDAENNDKDVEEVLLRELEEMGFKMVSLNKEVLRKNDYNFEQSLDELCNVNEWDLLLDELQGMGFVDRDTNKKVLEKNKGSLKHAVMDLITRESA